MKLLSKSSGDGDKKNNESVTGPDTADEPVSGCINLDTSGDDLTSKVALSKAKSISKLDEKDEMRITGDDKVPVRVDIEASTYSQLPIDLLQQPDAPESGRLYHLPVDPLQEDRATKIVLFSAKRPHMRAFHFAWFSFFCAFLGWFSLPPLFPTIKKELGLSKTDITTSNILAVSSTMVARLLIGPVCDKFGPRRVQMVLLCTGCITVTCAMAVNDLVGLCVVRFFIGFIGCAFVCTQLWTSNMFAKEIVGTANALSGGWGNLGGGAAYLIMPGVFDLITLNGTVSDNIGWRLALLFPALMMLVVGLLLFFFSDDTPHGKSSIKHKKDDDLEVPEDTQPTGGDISPESKNIMSGIQAVSSTGSIAYSKQTAEKPLGAGALLKIALTNPTTWILLFQYACCFGVELTINNVIGSYFFEDFKKDDCVETYEDECAQLTQSTAGVVASLFGLMNLFARALGGWISDKAMARWAMRGRVAVLFLAILGAGLVLIAFSFITNIWFATCILVIFSIFVQSAEGATFGIVPYVMPKYTGTIAGAVGAGGNLGAICWGFLFRAIEDRQTAMLYLGCIVAGMAFLNIFIRVDPLVSTEEENEHVATTQHQK
eukprot:CFRG4046T1